MTAKPLLHTIDIRLSEQIARVLFDLLNSASYPLEKLVAAYFLSLVW